MNITLQPYKFNPHTFVREINEYVYLENQVSHTKAYYKKSELNDRLLQQLHELWLIDLEDAPYEDRNFSYKNKAAIDRRFADFVPPEITMDTPWLQNLQIELTYACNERCIHCYLPNREKDTAKSLTVDTVLDILTQYRAMNGLKVVFSGGEIFLHKDIFRILEECKRLNLMILLQSNLLALTSDMLQRIKALDIFNMQVSLYSTDEHIHDAITGRKGSWHKTKKNLELLVEHDIPVLISCPVMQQNYSTVRDLQKYADSLGVDIYFDYIMMAQSDGCSDNLSDRLTLEQTRDMIVFTLETRPQYLEAIASSPTLEELVSKSFARRWNMCRILSSGLCIDSDGSAYPCPGWNGMVMGNIASSDLKELWEHAEIAVKLRAITQKDFKKCQSCNLHNFCDMCSVYNYNETGDIFHVCQRFCDTAQLLKECVIDIYKNMKGE